MRRTSVCIMACLLSVISGFSQHGVGPLWGDEVLLPISNSLRKQRGVLYNNMAVLPSGRICVSTTETNPGNTGLPLGHFLCYSDDGGAHWSAPAALLPPKLLPGGNGVKLVAGTGDTLFAIWSAVNPPAVFLTILDRDFRVLRDTIRVVNKQLYGNFATHFTSDRYGRLHLMWHEGNTNSPQTAEAFYTRSLDRGLHWETVQPLSRADGRHSAFPHADFDVAGDTLAIPWRDSVQGNNWDIQMVYSTNGGASWSQARPVVASGGADWDPALLIDPYGRMHLFYHLYPMGDPFWGAQVRYTFSDDLGSSWQLPVDPSGGQLSAAGMRSQLVEGLRYSSYTQTLWLSWKDERDFDPATGNVAGDMMVTHSKDRGQHWATPEFATDRGDSTLGFKAAALLPDGSYCVNYEVISPGDINDPAGFLRVYFRKRQHTITVSDDDAPGTTQTWNFPNPVRGSVMPTLVNEEHQPIFISVFSLSGQQLAAADIQPGASWSFPRLLPGEYLLKWTNGSSRAQTLRLTAID
ncbi:MAG: exo-alpha-sialidase [Saprospiraceae bacterium]|nr:exo-alpha-sialidase [Saprospiraceae bacterium]